MSEIGSQRMVRTARNGSAVLFAAMTLVGCAGLSEPQQYVVFFPTDQATLTPEAKQVVELIAEPAREENPSRIVVVGHADGDTAHDAILADNRATTVINALTAAGVQSDRIEKETRKPPASVSGVAAHKVVVQMLP
jgi:outer membrane protein OmpA-like peptidoglycan-associated protein